MEKQHQVQGELGWNEAKDPSQPSVQPPTKYEPPHKLADAQREAIKKETEEDKTEEVEEEVPCQEGQPKSRSTQQLQPEGIPPNMEI